MLHSVFESGIITLSCGEEISYFGIENTDLACSQAVEIVFGSADDSFIENYVSRVRVPSIK